MGNDNCNAASQSTKANTDVTSKLTKISTSDTFRLPTTSANITEFLVRCFLCYVDDIFIMWSHELLEF